MCQGDCQGKNRQAMLERTDAIIAQVGTQREQIIPLLQALQAEFAYLPSEVLERV